jgi:hypothetical protein
MTDEKQIISLMESVKNWYHRIELAPQIITPGFNASPVVLKNLDELGLPRDGSNCEYLISDAAMVFLRLKWKKEGRKVVGIDYALPIQPGSRCFTHSGQQSDLPYRQCLQSKR